MIKLNLGSGGHPLPGFVNLDRPNWEWVQGLSALYAEEDVDAITISHSLMYCDESLWAYVFAEMYHVLKPGGIVRITEDATNDPRSERFGGFRDCITLTSEEKVEEYFRRAQFIETVIWTSNPQCTLFADRSLIQQWHGPPPKVFHIEGRK